MAGPKQVLWKGRCSPRHPPLCLSSQARGSRTDLRQDSHLPKMSLYGRLIPWYLQGRTAGSHNLFVSPSPLTLQPPLQMLTCAWNTLTLFICVTYQVKGRAAQSSTVILLNVSNKHHCKFYLLLNTVIKLKDMDKQSEDLSLNTGTITW